MQQQFLPSGRMQYFPMCEYTVDGRFHSVVSGTQYEVVVDKIVDATYMDVQVPSVRGPLYDVAEGVQCMPLNDLPKLHGVADGYVVIGAGKTGMDACLWILRNEVDPDLITWIMPRDSWMLDRANIQPGEIPRDTPNTQPLVVAEGETDPQTIEELFDGVNRAGGLLRLSEEVRPVMYRCATVTRMELEALRKITNVVRKGHVVRIEADAILLDEGSVPTSGGHVHIDCTADGLARRPAMPVFNGDQITLQSVRTCQQVFSAAFIGHCESAYADEAHKNLLCTPVPHPDTDLDWLRVNIATTQNSLAWSADAELSSWLAHSRLDGFNQPQKADASAPSPKVIERFMAAQAKFIDKQQELLDRAEKTSA